MNAYPLPEILPADLDAVRRFLFDAQDAPTPSATPPAAPRPRVRPTLSTPVVRQGITRARSRPSSSAGGA